MNIRTILLGAVVVAVSFFGALALMNLLWPAAPLQEGRPTLVAVPPLQPLSGTSTVLTPAAVAMTAIRDALEAQAPKNIGGTPQGGISQVLKNATINWTIARGPLAVAGQGDALVVTTPLSGTFQAIGTLTQGVGAGVGAVGGAVGNLLGGSVGQQVQNLAGKAFNQQAQIRGGVTVTSRPAIAANWRLAPNLAAQVNIADVALPLAGINVSVANEVNPFINNAVRDQTNALETRLRNDPFIENTARGEWTKLCRSIPLGGGAQDVPNLWLEIRPVRAIAAQPKIDATAVTLLVGVQAETRIVPTETKPNCPFPAQLDIVPQANVGTVNIAVPIDMPLTEIDRLLEAQIAGKTYPEDGSGEFATTIKHAAIAASGDRLLISLLVNVKKRGLFSFFGADATVHVYGRPVLDADAQILRFTDVALDVQSAAAFGLLGAAAQAATPYLQKSLADKAVVDLKPFVADSKKRMAAAVGEFAQQGNGYSANVAINDLRLTGIAYDDKTLRVITSATGTVTVAISSLNMQ
jgi:hypothetical protein